MDLAKIKADVLAAEEEVKVRAKSEEMRLSLRSSVISRVYSEFIKFFKEGEFKVVNEQGKTTATFHNVEVELKADDVANEAEKGLPVYFFITTPDGVIHKLYTTSYSRTFAYTYYRGDGASLREDPNPGPNSTVYPPYPNHQNVTEDPNPVTTEAYLKKDLQYHRDFIRNFIEYKHKYWLDDRDTCYETMKQLLDDV
jgi:hypothetical protein